MGLVIFDVDGTLTPQRPSRTAAFERQLCRGIPESCRELIATGHTLAVASNQGGIAKALSVEAVEALLSWVCSALGMSANCFASERVRKKPAPAMLLEIIGQFSARPADTWPVGDSTDDKRAAVAASVRFVLVTAFVASGWAEYRADALICASQRDPVPTSLLHALCEDDYFPGSFFSSAFSLRRNESRNLSALTLSLTLWSAMTKT